MRFLLREVARRLSGIPGLLQRRYSSVQGVGHTLQSLDAPVRRLIRPRKKPTNPRRHGSERRADQLSRKRRKVKVVHEPSMGRQQSGDTHANGAYIIGMTRFPAPPAGMFEITVLLGHTSTVAPSDVPSVFSSG